MSADNYGIIHRHRDGWGLSSGAASDDRPDDLKRPWFTAATYGEVQEFADTQYFEYGCRVDRTDSTILLLGPVEAWIVRCALEEFAYEVDELANDPLLNVDFTDAEKAEFDHQAEVAHAIRQSLDKEVSHV